MTPELRRRIGFTLGALLVYRLGTHVPLPGLDPSAMPPLYRVPSNDILETQVRAHAPIGLEGSRP